MGATTRFVAKAVAAATLVASACGQEATVEQITLNNARICQPDTVTGLGSSGQICVEYVASASIHHRIHAARYEVDDTEDRFRWNATFLAGESGRLLLEKEEEGEVRCATEHAHHKLRLGECSVVVLDNTWSVVQVKVSKHEHATRIFDLDGKCIVIDSTVDSSIAPSYQLKASSVCSEDDSLWSILDFDTEAPTGAPSKSPTTRPTKAPTVPPTSKAPTTRPTKAPTVPPTTGIPTAEPTRFPTLEPLSNFNSRLLLLNERMGEEDLMLGLGVSPGHDLLAEDGTKLQLKSYVKNSGHSSSHTSKMIWNMDSDGVISLTSQPHLVLFDDHHHENAHLGIVLAEESARIILKTRSSSMAQDRIEWQLVPHGAGYWIQRKKNIKGLSFCLTVTECSFYSNPEVEHWVCPAKATKAACSATDDCDAPYCTGSDCICEKEEFANRSCDKIEPGAYMKLMRCDTEYDKVQVFGSRFIDEDSDGETSTPQPTPQPTSTPEPTLNPSSSNGGLVSKGQDELPEGQSPALVFFLLLLCFLVLICLVLVLFRRRRRRKNLQASRAFGEMFEEDNDDQDFYNSFQSNNLDPIAQDQEAEGMISQNDRSSASAGLQERKSATRNKRPSSSTSSFDPHVTHFEQEQGFVARV